MKKGFYEVIVEVQDKKNPEVYNRINSRSFTDKRTRDKATQWAAYELDGWTKSLHFGYRHLRVRIVE